MSYSRPLRAGLALKQNPADSPGIQLLTLDSDIATTSSLGVVQVGSGLSITPTGVLSANGGGGGDFINVKLTAVDYSVLSTDYYVGATAKSITITLPLGIIGRVYIIKNQSKGNVTVKGTSGETLDSSTGKTLGSESSVIVVFDGTRWNII